MGDPAMTTTPNQEPADPFLDEVHRLKRATLADSGNDLRQHFKRLQALQEKYADRLIPAPPLSTPISTLSLHNKPPT